MKHTWNVFKSQIKNMKHDERKELLKQLQKDLMWCKTRRYHEQNTGRIKLLRRQIACLKTVMNVKGFGYNPR